MIQMKVKKSHIIRGVLAVLVGCFLFVHTPFHTFAAETSGSCGENLKWEFSGGVLTISGSGDMTDYGGDTTAPWFTVAEEIREIVLSEKLTSVGAYAFYGCTNLTSISIPAQTKEIGQYAFAECKSLLYVDLSQLEMLEKGVFQQCSSLNSITFPETLEEIGSRAFWGCEKLQVIHVPATVRYIGNGSFAYCRELVRATINAPLEQLPVWTFYGCTNLTDVSLAPEMITLGEYAFYDCNNLKGIYTQSKDKEVAKQLEQSQTLDENEQKQGFVATHKISDTSVSKTDDGDVFISTTVIQKEEVAVTIKKIRDKSQQETQSDRVISAVIQDTKAWQAVAEVVAETLSTPSADTNIIDIQLIGTAIRAEDLACFAGMPVIMRITTPNAVSWKIDMSEMSADSFHGIYELGTSFSLNDDKNNKIASDQIYQLEFLGNIDFNVTVGTKVGNANDLASLYVKDGSSYELINTMIVDTEKYAWFSLAGINKHTNYYIGMNVEKISVDTATIPDTMYAQYGMDNNAAYLMDEDGVQYRITGRSSRWGITGKQFAIYVGVVIAAVVLIVGSVMLAFNIIKKSREKYERMAEEEAIREKEKEEALRMEIMHELLGEDTKQK